MLFAFCFLLSDFFVFWCPFPFFSWFPSLLVLSFFGMTLIIPGIPFVSDRASRKRNGPEFVTAPRTVRYMATDKGASSRLPSVVSSSCESTSTRSDCRQQLAHRSRRSRAGASPSAPDTQPAASSAPSAPAPAPVSSREHTHTRSGRHQLIHRSHRSPSGVCSPAASAPSRSFVSDAPSTSCNFSPVSTLSVPRVRQSVRSGPSTSSVSSRSASRSTSSAAPSSSCKISPVSSLYVPRTREHDRSSVSSAPSRSCDFSAASALYVPRNRSHPRSDSARSSVPRSIPPRPRAPTPGSDASRSSTRSIPPRPRAPTPGSEASRSFIRSAPQHTSTRSSVAVKTASTRSNHRGITPTCDSSVSSVATRASRSTRFPTAPSTDSKKASIVETTRDRRTETKPAKSVRFAEDVSVREVDRWITPGEHVNQKPLKILGYLQGWDATPLDHPNEDGEKVRYSSYWGSDSYHQLDTHFSKTCDRQDCAWNGIANCRKRLWRRAGLPEDFLFGIPGQSAMRLWNSEREEKRMYGGWAL